MVLVAAGLLHTSPVLSADEGAQVTEEIVVTARFREESVQDIGASIASMTSEDFERKGINSISELSSLVPSLNIQERGPNRNEISIRGIGRSLFQQDLTPAPPNIGVYFDDVPVNVVVGSQLDIRSLDLHRVEVVRGPQGTLYGEGAQGGAIRYFSNDPDFSDFSDFGLDLSVNANSVTDGSTEYGGTVTVNVPFADQAAALRLSMGRYAQDGWVDNSFDGGSNNNDYEATVFRGVLLFEPNDNWRVRLSGHFEDFEQGSFISVNPQDPDSREFCCAGTSDNFVEEDSTILSAKVSYEFEKFTVESITSYYERNRERRVFDHFFTNNELVTTFFLDFFGASAAVFGGPFPINDPAVHSLNDFGWEQFSQEFRIVSNFEGRINFVAGAFYRDFEFDQTATTESDLFASELPFYLGNLAVRSWTWTGTKNRCRKPRSLSLKVSQLAS